MATILIVDDDPTARELLATVLGYARHDVHEAADGADALARVATVRPEMIIADLLMPTMDGLELVRRLRLDSAFVSTPVIFYTASYLESEARRLADACGVANIITKPAEPEKIIETVQAVLGTLPVALARSEVATFEREHLGLLASKVSKRAAEAVPRLDAMIELSLQLASERDPRRLLASFCGAARKIIGARYATVGVLDRATRKLRFEFASGMSTDVAARLTSAHAPLVIATEALSERSSRRLHALDGDPRSVGLPVTHPQVQSFLSAPILSPDKTYGWLCLADKIGGYAFNEEDEDLARILAAQVGRIYENGSLYAEVKKYAERLESEIAERERTREEIRRLNTALERRVAERTAELELANKELESFSFSVSHDLRAPLRAINGFSELLLTSETFALPESGRDYLGHIRDAAGKMGRLIDDLLDLSRVSRRELNRRAVDLSALATGVVDELRAASPGRSVECVIEPGLVVHGDPNLLQIALVNLLGNAWKFTSKRADARIELRSTTHDGRPAYVVRDNGAGFEMKYVARLFGAFQRLHHEREFPGTGIGLAIVQRIIRRHGGDIHAQGETGEGASFTFTLGDG